MSTLLALTNSAEEQIIKIISQAPEDIDSVVVGIDKSGCNGYSYKLELGQSKDLESYECVNNKKAKVFVDPKAIMFLLGSTMDYKTDKLSSRFVFDNPNEKSTCGCGESFNF